MGQTVHVLDPFHVATVDESYRARFNPLDALDITGDNVIGEAGRIADALVIREDSKYAYWDESARAMLKGLILHILTAPEFEGRRNLVTLRELILRGDGQSVEEMRQAGEKTVSAQALLWQGVSMNPAFSGLVSGIGDSFASMLADASKQFESVRQTADRNTEFMDETPMQRALAASDFKLADLKTRGAGVSLYLSLPQRYMPAHYRWLRMMISLTIAEMEKTPWPSSQLAQNTQKAGLPTDKSHAPVLMILDEFTELKRMEIIETAVAQIAGYGVKLVFVLQSLEQLKAVYKDNWETFLANCLIV